MLVVGGENVDVLAYGNEGEVQRDALGSQPK